MGPCRMPARRIKGSCARVPRPLTRRTGDAAARGCLQHPHGRGNPCLFSRSKQPIACRSIASRPTRPRRWKRLVASLSTTTIGLRRNATTSPPARLTVTGIWSGENAAYSGAAAPIPSHYVETPQRIALHLEVLLGLVKVLASQSDTERLDS